VEVYTFSDALKSAGVVEIPRTQWLGVQHMIDSTLQAPGALVLIVRSSRQGADDEFRDVAVAIPDGAER